MAAMLECFGYSHRSARDLDSVVFDKVKNKFHSIHHLTLSPDDKPHSPYDTCGLAICQAFPSARYLEIYANEMDRIFTPLRRRNGRIIDGSNSLEQVIIYYTDSDQRPFGMDSFIWWLAKRIGFGQRRLRVKLAGIFPSITETRFVAICDRLRECCILELANVTVTPSVCLSMSEYSPLRVVSTSLLRSISPTYFLYRCHLCGLSSLP